MHVSGPDSYALLFLFLCRQDIALFHQHALCLLPARAFCTISRQLTISDYVTCNHFLFFLCVFSFQLLSDTYTPCAFFCVYLFLLLARYVPNVVKRSIWDQCKKKYILRINRRSATGDQRPTDLSFGQYWGNFKWLYLREGLSDPLNVRFNVLVFEVGGSNGAISGFAKSKMAARPPSWKIQMAISPRRIVRFTPCLVLGWGVRGRRIEWR